MSIILVLAKVAIGYAQSRGITLGQDTQDDPAAEAEPVPTPADPARASLARLRDPMKNLQEVVAEVKGKSGRQRLRGLAGRVAENRGLDIAALTGQNSAEAPAENAPPDPGTTAVMTALSGAAATSEQSIDGLLDAFNETGTTHAAEDAAALMLRAMIQAAKADGDIDATERARIIESVGADAGADELDFVKAQLDAPLDVAALASATPEAQILQVYTASLMSIRVDTPPEVLYLDGLAQALGLDQRVINALHQQLGVVPLYR